MLSFLVEKMKTSGKRFEENFKKSIPSSIFYYRLRDGSSSWGGNDKVRFQQTNICDAILFDGSLLFTLELKSTKGKSLPFSNIKKHQIKDLLWCNTYKNVVSGFVIEFSDLNECYFVKISDFKTFQDKCCRKSLPIDYCRKNGLKIGVICKKVNRYFKLDNFIKDIHKELI